LFISKPKSLVHLLTTTLNIDWMYDYVVSNWIMQNYNFDQCFVLIWNSLLVEGRTKNEGVLKKIFGPAKEQGRRGRRSYIMKRAFLRSSRNIRCVIKLRGLGWGAAEG
jgi:hypothetical protein